MALLIITVWHSPLYSLLLSLRWTKLGNRLEFILESSHSLLLSLRWTELDNRLDWSIFWNRYALLLHHQPDLILSSFITTNLPCRKRLLDTLIFPVNIFPPCHQRLQRSWTSIDRLFQREHLVNAVLTTLTMKGDYGHSVMDWTRRSSKHGRG